MFKIKWPISKELDAPKTWIDFKDLFDPRINKLWDSRTEQIAGIGEVRDSPSVSLSTVKKFIRAMYSVDNLHSDETTVSHRMIEHSAWGPLPHQHNSLTETHLKGWRMYLKTLTPDQLIGLAFLRLQYYDDTRLLLKFVKPKTPYVNNNIYGWESNSTNHATVTLPRGTTAEGARDIFISSYTEVIQTVADAWKAHVFNPGYNSKWAEGDPYFNGNSVIHLLFMMMRDQYYTTGNSRLNASSMMEGNEVHISVEWNGANQASIHASIPINDTNRTALYTVHSYNTNVMSVFNNKFIKLPKEHKPTYYGVELELTTDYSVNELIDAQHSLFFLAKNDSSISGSKRFRYELVTVPMSLRAQKMYWARWFNKLDYNKFDTTRNTTNGMHVHIGRDHFDDENHVKRMAWFYNNPANRDILVDISQRDERGLNSYATMYSWSGDMSKKDAIRNCDKYVGQLRGAVNLGSGKGTVEVRLFKGIVSYACIVKNLEFVDAVLNYTSEHLSMKQTFADFYKWLMATPTNKYLVLKKFLDSVPKLNEKLEVIPLHESLFGSWNKEDKIVEIFNKSGKINNNIITWFNKKKGKRTIILDKATGKAKLYNPPSTSIAALDRDLEAQYTPR